MAVLLAAGRRKTVLQAMDAGSINPLMPKTKDSVLKHLKELRCACPFLPSQGPATLPPGGGVGGARIAFLIARAGYL
jgi:hypothetical protein